MRQKKAQRPYTIVLVFESHLTRTVKVWASSREVAESRALKRNKSAIGVKQNA
jgi:hypothetical protein